MASRVSNEQAASKVKGVNMQTTIESWTSRALREAAGAGVLAALLLAWPAGAALQSGVYQTVPGTMVEEFGDALGRGTRVVPWSATLQFSLNNAQPSLTAEIANAVLEGGDPFPLTVRSASGSRNPVGTYYFSGDYLKDLQPTGTQYFFDWRFSTSTDGRILWNGSVGWAGGHIWQVTISDLELVPAYPHLD